MVRCRFERGSFASQNKTSGSSASGLPGNVEIVSSGWAAFAKDLGLGLHEPHQPLEFHCYASVYLRYATKQTFHPTFVMYSTVLPNCYALNA